MNMSVHITVRATGGFHPISGRSRSEQPREREQWRTPMLAEIYLLWLQCLVRSRSHFPADATASNPRFVPVSLPRT
jgi:hypothetical protein